MEIKEVVSQKIWDQFVIDLSDYTFLQSWSWGEFQKEQGEKIWRLGFYDGVKLVGVCLVVSVTARRGKFLFVPHGPLFLELNRDNLQTVTDYLSKMVKAGGYWFLRISPWVEATGENRNLFREFKFIPAPTLMHTEETWLVPLTGTEEEILAGMRKTTRNLIRRGEREGIKITTSKDPADLDILYKLQLETVSRHHFVPFSRSYLDREFRTFLARDEALLFLGRAGENISSAAIIVFYGRKVFYFQSGSTETKEPVSYVLQWEVIKEAKKRGCTVYNLWGVAPENKPGHPWTGITIFKSGFGGFRKNYLHAMDLPLSLRYYLTAALEKMPRTWRSKLHR